MRMNFISSLVCFVICVKALTCAAAESSHSATAKNEVLSHMLQATTHHPTAYDTMNQLTFEQHNDKNLKEVIHNKGGAVAGAGAVHSTPGKTHGGASSLLRGRPFSILSSTAGHIIVEFLVFLCLFRLT